MKAFHYVHLILLAIAAPAFATVTVTTPTPGATVTSPVQYIATGTAPSCPQGIGSMGIYVNNVQVYSSHGAPQINTQLALNPGYEHTVVQEWDKCGHSSNTTINLNVVSQPGVVVTSPMPNSTVGSPVNFVATATTTACSTGIASMGVAVDGQLLYSVSGASLNTALAISPGAHTALVGESDNCGGTSSTPVAFTVAAQGGVVVTSPLPNSTVTSPVQYVATATAPSCPQGVGSMGIYVNNVQVYSSHGAPQISTQLTLNPGYEHTVVQEWDKCGHSATKTINLTVQSAPTATLSASPTTVAAGNPATLTWTTAGATKVSIEPGIGTVAASGSTTVTPSATTQYTLTASGSNGSTTATATVAVQASAPTAKLSASPTTITGGNTATLTWSTTNATTVSIDQGIGIVSASGSTTVSPTSTTQYNLKATDNSGNTATSTATVTVQTQGATNSPIQHLIIVMMQNHSLDNLFGTYPGVNGLDASLPSYHQVDAQGNTVSPTLVKTLSTADPTHNRPSYVASWDKGLMDKYAYTEGDISMQYYDNTFSGLASDKSTWSIANLWSYAQQYALADNFFASAMNSEPAQEFYMVAADPFDLTTASSLPYYDPCSAVEQQRDGNAGHIASPQTATTVGDQLTAAQVSWGYYQTNFINSQNGTCNDYVPQEDPFQYFTSTENSSHIQNFTLASFQSQLSDGSLPSVLWINPDGAQDMHPDPAGNILDGVEFLSEVVQDVQNSSIWPNSAIIVLWDESGGWYDHVAPPQIAGTEGLGGRVPVLIISPFAKTNYISHQQMDFVSILRFIQWNWNLGQLPASAQATREQQSGDLCDLLTSACGAPTTK